jgi:hypothetical protein
MFTKIDKCRICGNTELSTLLNLGEQYLTGVFPRSPDEVITSGPLELVKCTGSPSDACGLVQLRHSFVLEEMYGLNYGYRSGLNRSMVEHLHRKVKKICSIADLRPGDLVIDIGSNDSTLLQGYPRSGPELVGIDPTGKKFRSYYPDHIALIPEFFSSRAVKDRFGTRRAKVVTSIAMFYDLESPIDFMRQIHEVLADDGIWVFEQSYMPVMLDRNAYDTICHEHLEYYGLRQIKWMTDRVGFKIVDVEFNDVNGGSFSVMVAKSGSRYPGADSQVDAVLRKEQEAGLASLRPYEAFKGSVDRHRGELLRFLGAVRAEGKKLLGYGASTKGNVILQFCGVTREDMPFIAEVNKDKFGCFTPGTRIPIISEEQARAMHPDFFLVLPWHFRDTIIGREQSYLAQGGKLVFPLPRIDVVGR